MSNALARTISIFGHPPLATCAWLLARGQAIWVGVSSGLLALPALASSRRALKWHLRMNLLAGVTAATLATEQSGNSPRTGKTMGADSLQAVDDMRLFHTGEHACGYWPERTARDLVLDPRDPRLPAFYPNALGWGFRRSGDIVYRPHCAGCHACVAVRIPVQGFQPDRSQRRCAARNAHVDTRIVVAQRNEEHLALYQRYLSARHPKGGMDDHGGNEFDQFLVGSWSQGRFLELREQGRLLAVAVTDVLPDALSAVYTFYDPDLAHRGLGTLAILRQLEWAQRQSLAHLYLGYWIKGHHKMDYKRRFQPLEAFDGRHWKAFP